MTFMTSVDGICVYFLESNCSGVDYVNHGGWGLCCGQLCCGNNVVSTSVSGDLLCLVVGLMQDNHHSGSMGRLCIDSSRCECETVGLGDNS